MKYLLHVPSMSCEHCKMRLSKTLDGIGVKILKIDIKNKELLIETEDLSTVLKELEKIDYPVEDHKVLE